MNNKLFAICKKTICWILLAVISIGVLGTNISAESRTYTVGDLEKVIDGIVAWKQKAANTGSVQELINKGLSPDAGTSPAEWFIIALKQYKGNYDYSAYTSALNAYVKKTAGIKATDMQRIAMTYTAIGGNTEYVKSAVDTSIGKLGIMSYVYGLLLLDCGAYSSKQLTRNDIINYILSLKLSDGGWALSGSVSDTDITAMVLQALAPYYKYEDVKSCVNKALNLLSERQLQTGDYSSWGVRNAESGAQVICALSALSINCQTDKRFIKNGNTLIDGLLLYSLADGGFTHALGGVSNNTTSVQALYSLVSVYRQANGLGTLFRFTNKTINRETAASTKPPKTGVSPTATPVITRKPSTKPSGTAAASTVKPSGSAGVSGISAVSPAATHESTASTGTPEVTKAAANPDKPLANGNINHKLWAYLIIAAVSLAGLAILFITKKITARNIVLLFVVSLAAVLVVFFIS